MKMLRDGLTAVVIVAVVVVGAVWVVEYEKAHFPRYQPTGELLNNLKGHQPGTP